VCSEENGFGDRIPPSDVQWRKLISMTEMETVSELGPESFKVLATIPMLCFLRA
jgi:hypothetical protein